MERQLQTGTKVREQAERNAVAAEPLVAASPAQGLLRLQRKAGNRAVLGMLSRVAPAIQTKLTVNRDGDPYEREADRVADQVMRMPEPAPSMAAGASHPPALQRKCADCMEEEEKEETPASLSRKQFGNASGIDGAPAPPVVYEVLNSPGEPLDSTSRGFFEPRFGYDFSNVRVHSDTRAQQSAGAVNAQAYTVGRDIVLGPGAASQPAVGARPLLAHELAHVVQQSNSPIIQRRVVCPEGVDPAEGTGCYESADDRSEMTSASPQQMPDTPQTETGGSSQKALPPAPTPTVSADNPLVAAVCVFSAIKPSAMASGLYEGSFQGKSFSLNQVQYEQLQKKVREEVSHALVLATIRADSAIGRYEDQQKVDAHHWFVAPIVKALGGVKDPGPSLVAFVQDARQILDKARFAIQSGDLEQASRLVGDGERAATQASKMVAAYIDQIIDSSEMTITVLQGVKTASEVVFFLCAGAATGGAAGGAATALGLEGAGATTTLFGVTASTATWATAVGAGAAITEEVALGIQRAAQGEKVDWGKIATHAAIQIIVAKFSPGVGQKLSTYIGEAAAASPAIRNLIARVGMARVVTVATSTLMHEASQIFATVVEDTVGALRGQPVSWSDFGNDLFRRLADPKGLLMATVAGMLGGVQPEPERQPVEPTQPSSKLPPKSKTDNADWRSVNKELGLTSPRTKTAAAPKPPAGTKQTTAADEFLPTQAEIAAAFSSKPGGTPPSTPEGKPIIESTGASPRGRQFQSASMTSPKAFPRTIRADVGESEAYKAALTQREIGLEQPQGANVPGRADFVTAARDAAGKMWIIANDAKTYSGEFPEPQPGLRPGWREQVRQAVDRANVGDPKVRAEIQEAFASGRIWVRQLNVVLSPSGQVVVSGLAAPTPVPWGPLTGPVDFDDKNRKR